jgi:hypothetical protein
VTNNDVLISRTSDHVGQAATATRPADSADDLWTVTAAGKAAQTLHPFTAALDVALVWATELGGEIYRRDEPGVPPHLYKPAS